MVKKRVRIINYKLRVPVDIRISAGAYFFYSMISMVLAMAFLFFDFYSGFGIASVLFGVFFFCYSLFLYWLSRSILRGREWALRTI